LGLPLTPGLAREIIEELFQHQRLWTTGVLIEKVPQEHRQKGGIERKRHDQERNQQSSRLSEGRRMHPKTVSKGLRSLGMDRLGS
jgi:hypothetical protein